MNQGKVLEIVGARVDFDFSEGELPDILNAVEAERADGTKLVLEVQQHLGENRVRAVAMDTTDGLVRGTLATDRGEPISVPVGDEVLGRVFDVTGQPIDGAGPVEAKQRYSIHRHPPPQDQLSTVFWDAGDWNQGNRPGSARCTRRKGWIPRWSRGRENRIGR